ncbi:MAG: substrate-binding domain-containing protein [Clostridiales Family XIII bacterium]|jgi:phosphate transport system substrate-binding protein|nr:substrate-binding domain-containing protein [Clostridiales Family XIII bacterium]
MERIEKKKQKCSVRDAKRLALFAVLLCLLASLIGCGAKEEPKEDAGESTSAADFADDAESPAAEAPVAGDSAPGLRLAPEEFPHVDGSTLTIPFSEAMAATVMGLPLEEARLYVLHSKAQDAYANLITGRADIIFALPPTEAELAYAKEQEVQLRLTPILHSTLTFFVNAKNPVDSVRLDDIVGIYSDKIKNWKDLGGGDAGIRAYQRPENSGSQRGMLAFVMKETPIAPVPAEMIYAGPEDIINAVASFQNAEFAIGYSYYYHAMDAQSDG